MTKPVRYKKLGGGWLTLLVLLLAGVGAVASVTVLGKRLFPRSSPVAPGGAAETAAAAKPAPAPTSYRALDMGDAVLVTVEVKPRGATLFLDGEPMPSNPVRLPRGRSPHKIVAQADGYEPRTVEVVPDAAKLVRVDLRRARR